MSLAVQTLRLALEALPGQKSEAYTYYVAMLDELPTSKSGTMKAWFQSHDGQVVETLQVKQNGGALWAPGARTIDASLVVAVVLSGSSRYYSGFRVLASSHSTLLVESDEEVIVYRVVTPASPTIEEQ